MDRKEFEKAFKKNEGKVFANNTRDEYIHEALEESKGKPITEDWEHLVIAMEELSELQKEISKYLRGKGNRSDLLQEMADVYICLSYIKEICSEDPEFEFNGEDIINAIDVKLDRCHKRIVKIKDKE